MGEATAVTVAAVACLELATSALRATALAIALAAPSFHSHLLHHPHHFVVAHGIAIATHDILGLCLPRIFLTGHNVEPHIVTFLWCAPRDVVDVHEVRHIPNIHKTVALVFVVPLHDTGGAASCCASGPC